MGIGKFLRNCGHKAVDYTIPRNATIACITSGAAWYGGKYTKTYAPGWLVSVFQGAVDRESKKLCDLPGCQSLSNFISHFTAPVIVSKATDDLEGPMGALTALVTCVTLNIFAALIYGPIDDNERAKILLATPKLQTQEKEEVKQIPLPPFQVPQPLKANCSAPNYPRFEEVTIDIPPGYTEVYSTTE